MSYQQKSDSKDWMNLLIVEYANSHHLCSSWPISKKQLKPIGFFFCEFWEN